MCADSGIPGRTAAKAQKHTADGIICLVELAPKACQPAQFGPCRPATTQKLSLCEGTVCRACCLPPFCMVAPWALFSPHAAEPPSYFTRVWQVEDGLPQNGVTAFVQPRVGYIWLGTLNGLVGFDGVRFKVFDTGNTPQLQRSRVTALPEHPEGNLWIGTGSGGLAVLRAGKVGVANAPDNWQGRAVLAVSAASDGALWIGTEGAGLYRLRLGNWTHYGEEAGISNLYVWSVAEDASGRIWLGTWSGGLLMQQGDKLERAPGTEELAVPMPAILPVGIGELLIGTATGLLHYNNGRTDWLAAKARFQIRDVRTVVRESAGTVWFGMYGSGPWHAQ